MNIGDYFRIVEKSHFAHGQTHRCVGLPNIKVKGEPVLDLGCLVEFVIEDYYGKPCSHVVPSCWCVPCERPSMRKRVRSVEAIAKEWAPLDEGALPEFWDDMYAACRNKGEES